MKKPLLFFAVIALMGCQTEQSTSDLARLFADELTVVDLTHAVSARAPYWPGPPTSPFTHDTLSAHADGAPSMAAPNYTTENKIPTNGRI